MIQVCARPRIQPGILSATVIMKVPVMKNRLACLAAIAVLVSGCATAPAGGEASAAPPSAPPSAAAGEPIKLKTLSIDTFMPQRLSVSVDVPVVVPADYELAVMPKASPFSAYWMKPQDVAAANQTGDLPAGNGYMQGKFSDGVAYDKARDVFAGADDAETLQQMQNHMGGFSALTMERFSYGKYPVLLVTATAAGSGMRAYFMYIGINLDTNVVAVSLRPPGNSAEIGDHVWGELKKMLVKSASSPLRVFPSGAS